MSSAGNCCLPRFSSNATGDLAGRDLWTNILLHMLTDDSKLPTLSNHSDAQTYGRGACDCIGPSGGGSPAGDWAGH